MKLFLATVVLGFAIGGGLHSTTDLNCDVSTVYEETINTKAKYSINELLVPSEPGEEIWVEEDFDESVLYSRREGLKLFMGHSEDAEVKKTFSYGTAIKVCGIATMANSEGNVFYKLSGGLGLYVNAEDVLDHKPENVQLDVKCILQKPELPNGCEITALTTAMNYKGMAVDKCDLSDNYLPKSETLYADPNVYYLREPRNNGFYCFVGPLVTCIKNYNDANGTNITTVDLTGCRASQLYDCVRKDMPVVVWGTLYWNNPWKYDTGLYSNLHCMVLSGFNEDTVTITDPLFGITYIDKARFEKVWKLMGSRAMIVYEE